MTSEIYDLWNTLWAKPTTSLNVLIPTMSNTESQTPALDEGNPNLVEENQCLWMCIAQANHEIEDLRAKLRRATTERQELEKTKDGLEEENRHLFSCVGDRNRDIDDLCIRLKRETAEKHEVGKRLEVIEEQNKAFKRLMRDQEPIGRRDNGKEMEIEVLKQRIAELEKDNAYMPDIREKEEGATKQDDEPTDVDALEKEIRFLKTHIASWQKKDHALRLRETAVVNLEQLHTANVEALTNEHKTNISKLRNEHNNNVAVLQHNHNRLINELKNDIRLLKLHVASWQRKDADFYLHENTSIHDLVKLLCGKELDIRGLAKEVKNLKVQISNLQGRNQALVAQNTSLQCQ